jgi:hypothetical protein
MADTTESKVTNVNVTVAEKMSQVTSNLSDDDLKEVAIERLKWENRRKIAWAFSYATIAYGFLILSIIVIGTKEMADRVTAATDLLTWVFMGLLSVVALYFGGTVIEKFTGAGKKDT